MHHDKTLHTNKRIPPMFTSTGLFCWAVCPMPSWPKLLPPQHLTLSPVTITHVWMYPAAMAMAETPDRPNVTMMLPDQSGFT